MATSSCVRCLEFGLSSVCSSRLNYEKPKLLNLNPNFKTKTKLGLSCQSNSKFSCIPVCNENSVPLIKEHPAAEIMYGVAYVAERLSDVLSYYIFGHSNNYNLTIIVRLRCDDDDDDDGVLKESIAEASKQINPFKSTDIVLNEVLPRLVDTADRWFSSRLTVAGNFRDSMEKLKECYKDCKMLAPALIPVEEHVLYTPCAQVTVELYILDLVDDRVKDIRTCEDLKAFLQQLDSVKNKACASALWQPALFREEDTKTNSHITY